MERSLKVAHIVYSLEVGGLEKIAVEIIKHFNRNKIFPSVYCLGHKGEYAKELAKNEVGVSLVNNRFPLGNAFILAKIFQKEKIDIVHSHSGIYRDATLAGIIAQVPIIVHTDHGRFYPDKRWTRFNHRFFSYFRDKIIAVSDDIKDFMSKEIKINGNKIWRIYNGVDITEYNTNNIDVDKKKSELGISAEVKIIGAIGRLAPVKNHITLFHAFKNVKRSFKNVILLVVGNGPLAEDLKKIATQLNENGNIIFLGERNDVKKLLHMMDIVSLSSLHEGLSITLLEAMASGKPIVATNVGGNSELVAHGVTGFLVPPQNPDKMAEALVNLLRDDKKRQVMGRAGRERVEKKFNIQDTVKAYEDLYFSLAREKGLR